MSCAQGGDVTVEFLEKTGFTRPILVRSLDGLGMTVPPPNFSVTDVGKIVGGDRLMDIMDVATQNALKAPLSSWVEYFNTPAGQRERILNVISLEFSDTPLSRMVESPDVVRKIDWITRAWPATSQRIPPQVTKYCLMGVAGSYTDFHVDFGGSSVWYHVFRGQKVFYMIPPTPENMDTYKTWAASGQQAEIVLSDLVPRAYECVIPEGGTMFIPSGWIHAVKTPVDSLVFGGNFVHHLAVKSQLAVYRLEDELETPVQYTLPGFETLNWYATSWLVTLLRRRRAESTVHEIPAWYRAAVDELAPTLRQWTKSKAHRDRIPDEFVEDPHECIDTLLQSLQPSFWDVTVDTVDDTPDECVF
jgi:[histone H3]-dimethyl-L-lysine9 demethylase